MAEKCQNCKKNAKKEKMPLALLYLDYFLYLCILMKKLKFFCKKYPLTSCLIVVIWVICLVPIPENVPLGDVPMMDKWTHFVMYGTLCAVIWWEYLRRHQQKNAGRLFLLAFLAPILMSGVIELAQAYLTNGNRSGDWLDFVANSIGVVLGNVIGILQAVFRAKAKKDI